jgi:two-component system nitrate/nitrite response regulator NarL
MPNKKIRIVIVDDHPVVRRGVSETFAEAEGFDVVGEGGSAADAIALARDRRPDLIVLDVNLPGGGAEAVAHIHELRPQAVIMMLSVREDLATVRAALKAGAQGFVSKGIDGDDLVQTARRLLAGERYISPELAVRLVSEEVAPPPSARGTLEGADLTPREREIIELIGAGQSNQEIASQLGLSENTIKHYITPLLRKLRVRNRTEAALLVQQGKSAA